MIVVTVLVQLARQLQADGDADEQAQPRLLGDEHADRGLALGIVVAVMPAVTWGASAIATFSGLVLGTLAGLMLLRGADTSR